MKFLPRYRPSRRHMPVAGLLLLGAVLAVGTWVGVAQAELAALETAHERRFSQITYEVESRTLQARNVLRDVRSYDALARRSDDDWTSGSGGNVTWHIVTEPQGVEVVSEVSGQLLGRTPLTFAPQGLGAQAILLRQSGFLERRLLLDQGANTERSEVLVPAPSASQSAVPAVPALSSSSKSAAKSGKSAGEAGKSHSGSRRHGSRQAQ